jgi:hypothetical protein
VDKRLDRKVPFSTYRALYRLGRILLNEEQRGSFPPYWRIYPIDDGLAPSPETPLLCGRTYRRCTRSCERGWTESCTQGLASAGAFAIDSAGALQMETTYSGQRLGQLQEQGFLVLGQATDGRPTVTVAGPARADGASATGAILGVVGRRLPSPQFP